MVLTQTLVVHAPVWGGADDPLTIVVCDPDLPPPEPGLTILACSAANSLLRDTAVWQPTVWEDVSTWEIGVPGFTGVTDVSNPHNALYVEGEIVDATDTVYASRVQFTPISGGTELKMGPPYQPTRILDNLGMGMTTFDGGIEYPRGLGYAVISSLGATVYQDRLAFYSARWNASDGVWEALNPGFMLPTNGYEPMPAYLHRKADGFGTATTPPTYSPTSSPPGLSDPNVDATDYGGEPDGPIVPSRVAYGRIQWDYLWHGTCSEDRSKWCLPDHHPRLEFDDTGANLVAAGDCTGTCDMACPTATGAANEVKYDFRMISAFLEDAFDHHALPVEGQPFVQSRLSQRVALRVMPYSDLFPLEMDLDGDTVIEDWARSLSVPSFLTDGVPGCGISSASGTISDASYGGSGASTLPWTWVRADEADYVEQVVRLVEALADGGATPNVEGAIPPPWSTSFDGYATDPRVFSFDIGSAGSFGEWNLAGGDGWREGVPGLILGDVGDSTSCQPPMSTFAYGIQGASWWADLYDAYLNAFDAPTYPYGTEPSLVATGGPQLVGKFFHPTAGIEGDMDPADSYCYRPDDYVVGRRGAHYDLRNAACVADTGFPGSDVCHAAGGVVPAGSSGDYGQGRSAGVRFDSFLNLEHQDPYWSGEDAIDRYRRGFTMPVRSEVWRVQAFHAEIADTVSVRLSQRDEPMEPPDGILTTDRHGIWDLEESIRYAIARRFSVFNFKWGQGQSVVPAVPFDPAVLDWDDPGTERHLRSEDWCECHPGGGSTCVADQLERLLYETGARIHLIRKSVPASATTSSDTTVAMRWANAGNVHVTQPYRLEFAWLDEDDLDCRDPGRALAGTFPWPSCHEPTANLDDLLLPPSTFGTPETRFPSVSLSTFDVRDVDPKDVLDPEIRTSRDGDCASGGTAPSVSQWYGDSVGRADAFDYGDAPVYPSDRPRVDFTIQAPSTAGTYHLLYRFRDISLDGAIAEATTGGLTAVADSLRDRQVHLELPNAQQLGDLSQQRWYFFGEVDVVAP